MDAEPSMKGILPMSVDAELLASAPVLFDLVSERGRIVLANATQEQWLGFPIGGLQGGRADRVYLRDARAMFHRYLTGTDPLPTQLVRLQLRRAGGDMVNVAASVNFYDHPQHGRCLRLAKFPVDGMLERAEMLERENEVLSSIISTARDASYCVEFVEPVDLTAPEHEIVRQMFENLCVWRYCNESMAQMYKLPVGEDLNAHDVREVFPRNPENENFVRRLIASGFHVDGALARDHRYDGTDMFVENDVRADIRRGQLYRFWGTVRDTRMRRLREIELEHRASMALDILGALPDPVLIVNAQGRIEGANPAVEWQLGWRLDAVLGATVDRLVTLGIPGEELHLLARPAAIADARSARARCRDGRLLGCSATVAAVGDDDSARCAVVLRFPSPAEPALRETNVVVDTDR